MPGSHATSAAVARHTTQISADANREGPNDMRNASAAFMAPIARLGHAGVNQTYG